MQNDIQENTDSMEEKLEALDYCEMCETEKETGYEWNGDYICESCYSGLADRAEAQWESLQETLGGGN